MFALSDHAIDGIATGITSRKVALARAHGTNIATARHQLNL
jgi:hypothetical protein